MWDCRAGLLRPLLPLVLVAVIAGCGGSATTSINGPTATKCAVSLSNRPPEIPASGGTGNVVIDTARECSWSAAANDSWISLSGATSGQGAATIAYTVQANPTA